MRALRLGCVAALAGMLIASPALTANPDEVKVFLMNTGVDLDAVAKVRFRAWADGAQRFEVQLTGVPPGAYDVLADGGPAGTFTVNASGEGHLRIDRRPLPFDPRGMEIEVMDRAAKVYFRSVLPESGDKARETIDVGQSFADGGVVPQAQGQASYKSRRGKIRFDVKVQHLPAGTYRVYVSDEALADVTVVEHADGSTVGHIKLDSRFERGGRRLLTIDPLCEDLTVREAVHDETTDILKLARLGGETLCF
jgi:hypothetical protein